MTSAFLQGKPINRTVYLIPPKEYKKKDILWKLKKCVYGLSDAAKMWYEMVKDKIVEANITKCPHDESFFYYNDDDLEGVMTLHVDDFIYVCSQKFEDLLKDFKIGSNEECQFTYLGLQINQHTNKTISVSLKEYIKELKQIPLSKKGRIKRHMHLLLMNISYFDQNVVSNCG